MILRDAAPYVQTGDLIFVQGNGLFSRLIRLATQSKYSHVAAILKIGVEDDPVKTRLVVLESMEGAGVRMLPLGMYLTWRGNRGEQVDLFAIHPGKVDLTKFVDYLLSTWGESYSPWFQLLWSFWGPFRRLRKRLLWSAEVSKVRPFCSWNVIGAAIAGGWLPPAFWPKDSAEYSPEDVSRASLWTRQGPLYI